jgi:hypothetical protein
VLKKLLACFVLLAINGYSQEAVDSQCTGEVDHFARVQPSIEAKAGYFFFAASPMTDIYNQGGLDVQLAVAYPIWRGLQIYGSVEYLQKSGHSQLIGEATSIWQIPVNIGLKPVFTICEGAMWYFTLGPRYFYVNQNNSSNFVPKNVGKSGCGLFVNTGFNFILWKHCLIDFFGEYSYAKVQFQTSMSNVYTQETQLSGFTFGGGLGYAF